MKQDLSECLTVEGLKNTINECKSRCHAKDIEIETLQKNLKSEQENFNVCVNEKDSLRTMIKSQIEELKLIKEELLLFQRLKEGKQNSTNDGQSGIQSIQSSYENLKFDKDHDKLIEKLRRDLKKKGWLLKDAQLYISKLERKKENKSELNKLRDKIENLEDEKHHLLKLKKELLLDLEEVKLEKKNCENREKILERKYKDKMDENLSLSNQLIENEENFDDMILKYKTSINSISQYQRIIEDQTEELQILSLQNKKLKDDLNSNVAGDKDTVSNWRKSLELEKVARLKLESQLMKLTETIKKLDLDSEQLRNQNLEEKGKYDKLLDKYKSLVEEYDQLKIEHEKIVEQCKFLEHIVDIEKEFQ